MTRAKKSLAEGVLTCFNKGYINDFSDNDYFYDDSEDDIDLAYEMLRELMDYGRIAFKERYGI